MRDFLADEFDYVSAVLVISDLVSAIIASENEMIGVRSPDQHIVTPVSTQEIRAVHALTINLDQSNRAAHILIDIMDRVPKVSLDFR